MNKSNIGYFLIIGLLILGYGSYSQEVDGSAIFSTNCAACHTIGSGKLLGPDLKGVGDRRERNWIIRFIRNSQQMIADGDEQAVQLFQENNMIPMASFDFSDEQMEALLGFINGEEEEPIAAIPAIADEKTTPVPPSEAKDSESKNGAPARATKTPLGSKHDNPEIVQRKELPLEQRNAMKRSMLTGLLIAFGATTALAFGVYMSMKT